MQCYFSNFPYLMGGTKVPKVIGMVISIILLGSNAFARSLTIESYLTEKREDIKSFNYIWLDGVYNGLLDASVYMRLDNKIALFCPPQKMAMTTPQIESILNKYINDHKVPMDYYVDLTLLEALKEVFPCQPNN